VSEHRQHWNEIYADPASGSLSWFQAKAELSLQFIDAVQLPRDAPIIDVGAGTSSLVDGLLAGGFTDITLLDLSERALETAARRLEPQSVQTIVGDVTTWRPSRRYALWHDRAVFHFLTDEVQRTAYRDVLAAALAERGHVIVATFAPDGPERCSGLAVQRYGVEALAEQFSDLLRLVSARREKHLTPSGIEQPFVYVHFVRR
jgi:trans-aconitate methyltransferase